MAKEFFKDLPDTTTPITAGRLNGLLDGEEPMGDLVVDSIRTKNMFDKNSVLMGYEINSADGTVSTNSNYYVSDYIPVKPNTNYYLTKTNNGSSNCFYDINKNFISTIRKDQGVITTPDNSNVYYMRFNGPQSDLDNVQVEEGSVATEYKPFQNLDKTLDIYSTSEIRIGTWIDGKPIYRKVFWFDDMPSNSILTIADVSSLNIDMVVHMYGSVKHYQGRGHRPLPLAGGGSDDIRIDIDGNNLRLRTYSNWAGYNDNFIVLEYTKTTD